jgi:hypothetical protein
MSASFSNGENLMDVNRLEGTLRNTGKKAQEAAG